MTILPAALQTWARPKWGIRLRTTARGSWRKGADPFLAGDSPSKRGTALFLVL